MTARILKYLPYILLVGYMAYNEYRLADYNSVRYDAIIGVHYPELAKQHREQGVKRP